MTQNIVKKEIDFAGRKLVLETGKLATMTNMTVKASYGDTVVLVTVVSGGLNPDMDYFPLNINYIERLYSVGEINSSRFQKRDFRQTDDAKIAGRVIDHAIRPLFPEDFMDQVQIIATVMSLDKDCDPEFLAMIATSAALHASDVPWTGPMLSARVGYINDEYVLNPGWEARHHESDLSMMVSFVGEDKKFLAVEAEANALPEEKILGAMEFARNEVDPLYTLITDFAKELNPNGEKYEYESQVLPEDLMAAVKEIAESDINDAMGQNLDKDELSDKLNEVKEKVVTDLDGKFKKVDMGIAVDELKKTALRNLILETGKRPDGRGIKEIRPLSAEVGVLPRTHGSALFSRGITQSMTMAVLASPSQELLMQDVYGERSKRYMHHYNFPPYSSGEVGRMGFPKNREIGHGMIAENGLRPVIPSQEEFPYTIHLTTEILSSSGSTSMASTCGSTLALMDAGVPIKDMVAGIGVGLIADEKLEKTLIMTDLAYMEDAFGLLDFKMTGTRTGVTAIQSDMKSQGLPYDLIPKIIEQSREGRMEVLDVMEAAIDKPRDQVSEYAPKTASTKVEVEKIGAVIGAGGKVIKDIQEKTGVEVSIDDDGTVVAAGVDAKGVALAIEMVEAIVKEVEVGEIYDGVVEEVVDFGAFVEILPGKTGLLHVSELSYDYVDDVNSMLKAGDNVKVKVVETSRDGKIGLSIKALQEKPEGYVERPRPNRRPGGGGRGGRGGRNGRHGGRGRPNNRRN